MLSLLPQFTLNATLWLLLDVSTSVWHLSNPFSDLFKRN